MTHAMEPSSAGHVCGLPTATRAVLLIANGYRKFLSCAATSSSNLTPNSNVGSTWRKRNWMMLQKSFFDGPFRILGDSTWSYCRSLRNSISAWMQPFMYVLSASGRGSRRPPRADMDVRPPYTLLRRPLIPAAIVPTDWRDVELRGAAGGGRGAPWTAVETRRDDAAEGASGPMDWRPNALFVAPSEMRVAAGFESAVERTLSCEDEMGPSVVRRMVAAACAAWREGGREVTRQRAVQEERRGEDSRTVLVSSNGLLVKMSASA